MTKEKEAPLELKEKDLILRGIFSDPGSNKFSEEKDYDFTCSCGTARVKGQSLMLPDPTTCVVCGEEVE